MSNRSLVANILLVWNARRLAEPWMLRGLPVQVRILTIRSHLARAGLTLLVILDWLNQVLIGHLLETAIGQ